MSVLSEIEAAELSEQNSSFPLQSRSQLEFARDFDYQFTFFFASFSLPHRARAAAVIINYSNES